MDQARIPELMDDPALDESRHLHALRGLERINRWSRTPDFLWTPLAALSDALGRPLRVFDIASGSGDIAVALAQRARQSGRQISVDGCDISTRAVEFARQRAEQAGVAVNFRVIDALKRELPSGYDVTTCTLFLHHLDRADALVLLKRMTQAARELVLIDDLERTRTGLIMAFLGTRLLSRSKIVHVDGVRSVRAAYTANEARALAGEAGLKNISIATHWPCRYGLSGTPY